eukprot:433033_1
MYGIVDIEAIPNVDVIGIALCLCLPLIGWVMYRCVKERQSTIELLQAEQAQSAVVEQGPGNDGSDDMPQDDKIQGETLYEENKKTTMGLTVTGTTCSTKQDETSQDDV